MLNKPESETAQSNPMHNNMQDDNNDNDDNNDEEGLAGFLSFCNADDAPLGKDIRRFIFEKLSKEDGKAVLAALTSKTTKQNN